MKHFSQAHISQALDEGTILVYNTSAHRDSRFEYANVSINGQNYDKTSQPGELSFLTLSGTPGQFLFKTWTFVYDLMPSEVYFCK